MSKLGNGAIFTDILRLKAAPDRLSYRTHSEKIKGVSPNMTSSVFGSKNKFSSPANLKLFNNTSHEMFVVLMHNE